MGGWGVSLHNLIAFLRAICAPVRFSQTIQLHSIASALFLSFGMSCDVQLLTVARSPFFLYSDNFLLHFHSSTLMMARAFDSITVSNRPGSDGGSFLCQIEFVCDVLTCAWAND